MPAIRTSLRIVASVLAVVAFTVMIVIIALGNSQPAVAGTSYVSSTANDVPAPADPVVKTATVQTGDTLSAILLSQGVNQNEVRELLDSLEGTYDPRDLQPGQTLELTFSPDVPFLLTRLHVSIDAIDSLDVTRSDERYHAGISSRNLGTRTTGIHGTIDSSLYGDATGAGVPANILMALIDLYSFDVDFQRDIHPGDEFSVMYREYVDREGNPVKTGDILLARLVLSGRALPVYRYSYSQTDDAGIATDVVDYFDASGKTARKTLLKTPIHGAHLTSSYGPRLHPILGYSEIHRGLDFGAPIGTPILAAGDGTVELRTYNSDYGNFVMLRHVNGYETLYGHMSAFARGVLPGGTVTQGQTIGYVGTTGVSTGPHLHYEVRLWGTPVNPSTLVFPPGRVLSGTTLDDFAAARTRLEDLYTRYMMHRSSHS